MKTGPHRYKYVKQLGGRGHYGEVEIEINPIESNSIVLDDCSWKTLKQSYPNFEELEILKIWKNSAIEAAQHIVDNYRLPKSIEVGIKDIVGSYVDTVPAHFGAAVTIGVFDLIGDPLTSEDITSIDTFVFENTDIEVIPDIRQLVISKSKKS